MKVVRQEPAWQVSGREDGEGTPSAAEETQSEARVIASSQAPSSPAGSFLDAPGTALAPHYGTAGEDALSFDKGERVLDVAGEVGMLAAEAGEDAVEPMVRDATAGNKAVSHHGKSMGSAEQFDTFRIQWRNLGSRSQIGP